MEKILKKLNRVIPAFFLLVLALYACGSASTKDPLIQEIAGDFKKLKSKNEFAIIIIQGKQVTEGINVYCYVFHKESFHLENNDVSLPNQEGLNIYYRKSLNLFADAHVESEYANKKLPAPHSTVPIIGMHYLVGENNMVIMKNEITLKNFEEKYFYPFIIFEQTFPVKE